MTTPCDECIYTDECPGFYRCRTFINYRKDPDEWNRGYKLQKEEEEDDNRKH